MGWVVHAGLLILAVAALAGAALRGAHALGSRGLERAVAAAPLAVGAAVCEAILLGLLGWGTSPIALPVAAGGTWLLARGALPAPDPSPVEELRKWWRRRGPLARLGAGAVVGIVSTWSAWLVTNPFIGGDGLVYHVPKLAAWVQNGHPASFQVLFVDNPFGNYPATNEVALSWATGISRSLVPLTLWAMPFMMTLLAAAVWTAARAVGARPQAIGLGVAALCASPLLATQAVGPYTDLPALAWLACTGSLAITAAGSGRPALLTPTILSAGLAVGTKTTTLPLAAVFVALAVFTCRRRLREVALPLGLAGAGSVLISGVWYARNFIEHGSPFWPFTTTPWGDPRPPALEVISGRILTDPIDAVASRVDRYLDFFAGDLLLFSGALLAGVVVRSRIAVLAGTLTALAIVFWAAAPTTGFPADPAYDELAVSAFRYVTPALLPAVVALVLAGSVGGIIGAVSRAALLAALVWNVLRTLDIGSPYVPPAWMLAIGAGLGLLATAFVPRLARIPPLGRLRPAHLAFAIAAGVVVAVAATGPGYVDRHLTTDSSRPDVIRWAVAQRAFQEGDGPIAMAPHLDGVLAGDRLQHKVELIALDEPCRRIRQRARKGWVMIDSAISPDLLPELKRLDSPSRRQPKTLARCLAAHRPVYRDEDWLVFGPP